MKTCWPLLLLLIVAGCRKEEPGGGGGISSEAPAGSGNIRSVDAVADGDHRRVRVVAMLHNAGSTVLEAQPPAVQLWAGGKAVPPFIAPGLPPRPISPGAKSEVETFWWLSEADAGGALEFEVLGSRSRVSLP